MSRLRVSCPAGDVEPARSWCRMTCEGRSIRHNRRVTEVTDYRPAADRYESMSYRRCGRSGLLLPAVSLGLWQNFGDGRAIDSQRAILRRAFDLGITHF